MKKISIIVLAYNSSKYISNCLDSIYKNNDIGDDLEVIVVDNNSNDVVMLKEVLDDYPVNFVSNNANLGYGHGNNVGILKSSAEFVLVMNPDAIVKNISYLKIYNTFTKNDDCGIIGFQQYESSTLKGTSYLMLTYSIKLYIKLLIYRKMDWYDYKSFCFSGACFALRKSIFNDIGFFNNEIFMYGEERYLHLYLLSQSKIAIYDKKQSFIHPLHSRPDDLNKSLLGFKSYLFSISKYNLNKKRLLKSYRRFLKCILIKHFLLRNKEAIRHFKKLLVEIDKY